MNKNDPRVIKTLRQIDQALLDNLKTTAFDKITIDMLCKSALINRSTFYKYYVDKYDLLNNYINRVLEDFRKYTGADFVTATPYTIDDAIYTESFRELLSHLYTKKNMYLTLWNASIGRNIWIEMIDICENEIITTVNKNSSPSGANAKFIDLYARLFASDLMNVIQWWFKNDPTITIDDVMYVMNVKMKNGLFRTFKDYM